MTDPTFDAVTDSIAGAVSGHDVGHLYGADVPADQQRALLRSGQIPVSVYGLGKMGLPLAAVFAETTANVLGADIDSTVVESVNAGGCHVKREPELPSLVAKSVTEGALGATTEPRVAADHGAIHVVIVPTPITDSYEPDLTILDAVIEDISYGLEAGDLVIIECTVPPRTTRDRILPTLEHLSGLSRGSFGLAFCPERTSSGRAIEDIRGAYPKVVGGVDDESTRAATLLYEEINDTGVIQTSDATTAEAVKVFEGLYRDVNIALANELARGTDEFGISVREAIDVANTQPFCNIHDPGPGVGGHCIPFYPYFVIDPFEMKTPLLETARAVNDSMPAFTVETVRSLLEDAEKPLDDSSIVLLGLTYRPGVEEIRASPSLAIAEQLSSAGATVYGVDPMLDSAEEFALERLSLEELYERPFDAVIHVTPHSEFDSIRWSDVDGTDGEVVVVDGRDSLESEPVAEAGHRVYTIGNGVTRSRHSGGEPDV